VVPSRHRSPAAFAEDSEGLASRARGLLLPRVGRQAWEPAALKSPRLPLSLCRTGHKLLGATRCVTAEQDGLQREVPGARHNTTLQVQVLSKWGKTPDWKLKPWRRRSEALGCIAPTPAARSRTRRAAQALSPVPETATAQGQAVNQSCRA